mmetsp:Transcript_12073/g.14972  ORF Transcript_12073/g.14972 Transcript_12073/m.14972 type:complete len:274 (+) Transcript_12073:250-1071(+)
MDNIQPLSRPQQLFLQRLLASHVMTDSQAQALWNEVQQMTIESDDSVLGRNLNDTLDRINRSLKPAFGLEVRSVSLALNYGNDNDNISSSSSSRVPTVVYHAIINCDSDEVAKVASNPTLTKSPHELALFRLILERLVESDADAAGDENENNANTSTNRRGKGCQAAMSRMEMINLRLELMGPHEGKLNIQQAENALNLFEAQGWLVPAAVASSKNNDDPSTPNARRGRRSSTGGSSRAKNLQIGPRSYMEFPDFITKAGLENEQLPQFLLHA